MVYATTLGMFLYIIDVLSLKITEVADILKNHFH